MVIDYNSKFDKEIKQLLVELQEYIVSIDIEKYNIISSNYSEKYFAKTMKEIEKYKGKMLLYVEDEKVLGLIVGLVNNEECNDYDFKAPKRGRITELIISSESRSSGKGTILLKEMEEYLKSIGCKDILLGVFGYNNRAINFYKKNGYHIRMLDMSKSIQD